MKRTMVLILLLLMANLLLSGAGCATSQQRPTGEQPEIREPQWRPAWERDGRWDPHWVKNEPYRPWPL
jgi:outer membrane biogenesis lipoprotein LolB